jgi:hypothetical protein
MRAACFVSICLLAGCGEDSISVSADESNFCGEIAEVACHNMYQCCAEGEIEQVLGVSEPRTEAQCREDLTLICERGSGNALNDSIKAGRVTFDAAKMNDCLNTIVAPDDSCASVVDILPWTEACKDSSFVGTVATGGTCFFAHDCAGAPDNAYCAANQKCTQKPTAGFPCSTSNPCASAFYCNAGTCAPKLAAGAPCTSASQCDKDLFCDFNATPMPICTARAPGGSACGSDFGCASNTCIPGQCMGTQNECYKDTDCFSRCADDNSFCDSSDDCASGTCSVGGNFCTSNTSCTAGTGDTCVFPVLCLPGDCIGDPVCTAAIYTVDYCDGTFSALPLL